MLSHKAHSDGADGEEAQTGAEAGVDPRKVDVVPSTHTDTADFCLRADQDRLRDQPPPELAPRDTFEVCFMSRRALPPSAPLISRPAICVCAFQCKGLPALLIG